MGQGIWLVEVSTEQGKEACQDPSISHNDLEFWEFDEFQECGHHNVVTYKLYFELDIDQQEVEETLHIVIGDESISSTEINVKEY